MGRDRSDTQSDGAPSLLLHPALFHPNRCGFTAQDSVCVCLGVQELRFTVATGGTQPGERAQASAGLPVATGPVGTPAQQGAAGAEAALGTLWK